MSANIHEFKMGVLTVFQDLYIIVGIGILGDIRVSVGSDNTNDSSSCLKLGESFSYKKYRIRLMSLRDPQKKWEEQTVQLLISKIK